MKHLDRILALIKKTGDRCIILDHEGNPAFVLSSFDEYERLITTGGDPRHLTEDQLLDKINRDVDTWRSSQEEVLSVPVPTTEKPAETIGSWQPIGSVLKHQAQRSTESNQESTEKPQDSEKKQQPEDVYYFEPTT